MQQNSVLMLVLAGLALPLWAAAEERVAIDLNTYSTIRIDQSAAEIWPHIVEPNAWKPDRSLIHHRGPEGELGEVFAITAPGDPDRIWFLAENVQLIPNQRRTIKLYDLDARLLGFASWHLVEQDEGTVVEYYVHAESLLSDEQLEEMSPDDLAEARRNGYEVNKQRIDGELRSLKKLVESQ